MPQNWLANLYVHQHNFPSYSLPGLDLHFHNKRLLPKKKQQPPKKM